MLKGMLSEVHTKKEAIEQRLEGDEGVSHAAIQTVNVPDRGHSQCINPEVGCTWQVLRSRRLKPSE